MSLRRTAAVVRKELLHIIRDPRNLFLVTVAPALLLFLLSYIFSFDVTQIRLAVLDLDRSPLSRHYLADLTADGDLVVVATVDRYDQVVPLLTEGDADAGLVIPPGFADDIARGRPVEVQAIVDGTDPFASGQVIGSLESRSGVFSEYRRGARPQGAHGAALKSPSGSTFPAAAVPLEVHTQGWYNAGFESLLSMVPGLLPIVLLMPSVAFVLALARETETGTLEGLIATPVSAADYLAGKLVAYVTAGLISAILALLVAVLWFDVPYRGSLGTYLLLAGIYFLACMAAAVIIAHLVRSQQAAMFVFLLMFLVPSFFLSGLITPVNTDSLASLLTSYALPSTHFSEISRVLFLKGLGLAYLARPTLLLLGMALTALGIGLARFRKKLA